MSSLLSLITDRLAKTTYQNTKEKLHVDMKDDRLIINLLSKFILPILFIFGFYVHTHGDYTPGGGFQSGVIFACAMCLYYFINLDNKIKKFSHSALTYFTLCGFTFYLGFGFLSFCVTGKFLDFTFLPFNHNNARGVFIVETGIALVVFSSVTRIFTTLLNAVKETTDADKNNVNNKTLTKNQI